MVQDLILRGGIAIPLCFRPAFSYWVRFALAPYWQRKSSKDEGKQKRFDRVGFPLIKATLSGRRFVALVLCMALIGSQVMVLKRSNLKFYRADRLIDYIQANSTLPVVIGDSARISAQPVVIGMQIMAVGWEIQRKLFAGRYG